MAKRLFRGVGCERDVEEATFWFRRAAESGSAREAGVEDATYWLARSYLYLGDGKADVERGIELLREAAAEGSEAAAFELKRRKLSDDD